MLLLLATLAEPPSFKILQMAAVRETGAPRAMQLLLLPLPVQKSNPGIPGLSELKTKRKHRLFGG